jgi:hypothetical protein
LGTSGVLIYIDNLGENIMSKSKLYNYVGSEEIKLSVINFDSGTVIRSISDIRNWIDNTCDRKTIASNLVVATFTIDM